jgi:cytochrome b6-f complex iron-sulfur subunit
LYVVFIIVAVLVIAAGVTIWLTAGRSRGASTGSLSRETRRRDDTTTTSEPELSTSTELEATGRERADETRASSGTVARRRRGEVVEYEPVDEEEIGVSRRQFLNRGLLTAVGFGVAGFGAAALGFLWPPKGQPGFGGSFVLGKETDIKAYIAANRAPFYAPQARTYVQPYPQSPEDLAKAKKVYKPAIYQGMEQYGLVALYQRCVHLGCRVPWCQSSQWFECPCHGSKYNRVGEKKAGPAPRGLDRFRITVNGGSVSVDTGVIFNGPPIGTNTTGQQQEGPLCV